MVDIDIAYFSETWLLAGAPLLPPNYEYLGVPARDSDGGRPSQGAGFAVAPRVTEDARPEHHDYSDLAPDGQIQVLRIHTSSGLIIIIGLYRHAETWRRANYFAAVHTVMDRERRLHPDLEAFILAGDVNVAAPPLPHDSERLRFLPPRHPPLRPPNAPGQALAQLARANDLTTVTGRSCAPREVWTFANLGTTRREDLSSTLDFVLVSEPLRDKVVEVIESEDMSTYVHLGASCFHKAIMTQLDLQLVHTAGNEPMPRRERQKWNVADITSAQKAMLRAHVVARLRTPRLTRRLNELTADVEGSPPPARADELLQRVIEEGAEAAGLADHRQQKRKRTGGTGAQPLSWYMSRYQLTRRRYEQVAKYRDRFRLQITTETPRHVAHKRFYTMMMSVRRNEKGRVAEHPARMLERDGTISTSQLASEAAVADYWKSVDNRPLDKRYDSDAEWANRLEAIEKVEPHRAPPARGEPPVMSSAFRPEVLERIIRGRPNGKTPGDDGVSFELIKALLSPNGKNKTRQDKEDDKVVIDALLKFFNICYTKEKPPGRWAHVLITLVFKGKGDPRDPSKYRPLSLVPVMAKIFHLLILDRLDHLWSKDLIRKLRPEQAAYRAGRSKDGNTHMLANKIRECRAKATRLIAAAIDFRKAYNGVSRSVLFTKLHDRGITGKMWRVIRSLYTDTSTQIKFRNKKLPRFGTDSGIYQGAPLSCVLFNIMIDDLAEWMLRSELEAATSLTKDEEWSIEVPALQHKLNQILLQYSDDTLFIAYSEHDMSILLTNMANWAAHSQLDINFDRGKTDIILLSGDPPQSRRCTTLQPAQRTQWKHWSTLAYTVRHHTSRRWRPRLSHPGPRVAL